MLGSRAEISERLRTVSYYRLSAYWYPFRTPNSDDLRNGTTFEQVWALYTFDRQLRLLVMDPIERIEVFVRSQMALLHSALHGPMGYITAGNLPNITTAQHQNLIVKFEEERARASRNAVAFVTHFENKYVEEHHLPVWMAIELISFGGTQTFFRGLERALQNEIASQLGVNAKVLRSWLVTLGTFRNICAHHERLWNRSIGSRPLVPSNHQRWRGWANQIRSRNPARPDYQADNSGRVGTLLMMLRHWMAAISPDSDWPSKIVALFADNPTIDLESIGLPPNWQTSTAWTY